MKGLIVVKVDKCVGCHSCEMACAVEHSQSKTVSGAAAEKPAPRSRVKVESVRGAPLPMQCRQCGQAACVEICPKDALSRGKPGEPVVLDDEKCIRCRWCVLACPYGMVSFDKDGKSIIKCDQCYQRVERGEMPACVEACPTGALAFEVGGEKAEAYLVRIERAGARSGK